VKGRIPEVSFDVGESYAGLLPLGAINDTSNELFYWFFPTANAQGKDDIIIWLNGGPGCSSLEGFLQENGPILWQYGTYKPVPNPWSWTKLANVIWVEQPVGTGFSKGNALPADEVEAANQFLGFWKNFMDTFPSLQGKKIYIAGESYAGLYVPYLTNAMLDKKDTKYYNIKSFMIFDAVMSSDYIAQLIPLAAFVTRYKDIFGFNDTYVNQLNQLHATCGFTKFRDTYLSFPSAGSQPQPDMDSFPSGCLNIWNDVFNAVSTINPCFDMYDIATYCPLPWDVLGFPGSIPFKPKGSPPIYFDRADVRRAINAPTGSPWAECTNNDVFKGGFDRSPPSSFEVIPKLLNSLDRSIIVHGQFDFILLAEGSLLAIQNMTWHGTRGFTQKPSSTFMVPSHPRGALETMAGAGDLGIYHTERNLTYVEVRLSGHMGK
jgi:carboxypeptidase D